MIEYVQGHNPDDRVLTKASKILKNGGLLCFPTETNWVIVCDPFQKDGVDKLYRLRHIENSKHLIMFCSTFQKAMEIAFIDDSAFRLMKRVVPGPYTFIFEAQKKITKFLKASKVDKEVGLRFPPQALTQKLLNLYDGLLLSSSITHDMIEDADIEIPLYSAQIEESFGNKIDMIIDPGEYEFLGQTTIINFTSGFPEIDRIGIGPTDIFE